MSENHPDPHDEDVTVLASISGGKDSAAMALWLIEQGIKFRSVFMDTGWEHPATYEYLRGTLTDAIGPIEEIRGPKTLPELIEHKGSFPSRLRRYCTRELKIKPFQKLAKTVDSEIINAVGVRAAESRARANMAEWEYTDWFDGWTWRPFIAWSEQDVIDMHKKHGLMPNPLYLKGARRVGCFPCIHARKTEITLVAELYPERIDIIRDLEEVARVKTIARYEARGTTLEEKGHHPPTFFCPSSKSADKKGLNRNVPIDDMVEWAATDRGGKQLLLLDKDPPGCMRWGLCDSLPPEDDDE